MFVIEPGAQSHLSPGIYQRMPNRVRVKRKNGKATATGGGTRLKTLALFQDAPTYAKRYDLPGVVQTTVSQNLGDAFSQALDRAIRTAR